jgi:asparagine synthase (glutamine-hydrolysing)
MCGIVGVHCGDSAPPDPAVVRNMIRSVGHRGPDAERVEYADNIVLGAARLSILDTRDHAAQPLVVPGADGGVLAYNGELYNWRSLRQELSGQFDFRTTSDSEVVLAALRIWGVAKAVRRFDGMFAFAYYDRRSARLWLARDRLGIKPLYVSAGGGTLVFGSEIKALLAHPAVAVAPNPLALVSGLILDNLEEPWTPFAGIDAFPRGQIWQIDAAGSIDREEYWNLVAALDPARLAADQMSMGTAAEKLDEILRTTVATHLDSDVPVTMLVSGGLDSSLTAAYASGVSPGLVGFTADVESAKPELARAVRVADHLGLSIQPVTIRHEDYLRAWPEAVWHQDVPLCVASDPAFLLLSRACHEHGFKVALSGEGADELFCGYPWQQQAGPAWRRRAWQHRLGLAGPLSVLGRALARWTPMDTESLRKYTFGNFEVPDPTAVMRQSSALHGGQKAIRHREIEARLAGLARPADRGLIAACVNSMYGHLGALLRRNDRLGMASSVEVRVPYLANEVIDFAINLPMSLRYRRSTGKRVLRSVAGRYLPGSVVSAPKWGFATSRRPFAAAIPLIRSGVTPELLGWSSRTTNWLLTELAEDPKPVVLFLLGSVELWARLFLRGESPHELGERLAAVAPAIRGAALDTVLIGSK